jgi:rubrerythrin
MPENYRRSTMEYSDKKKTDFEMVSYALNEEMEGVDWYAKHADWAENPEVKALFQKIQIEEKKHASMLLQLMSKITQQLLS